MGRGASHAALGDGTSCLHSIARIPPGGRLLSIAAMVKVADRQTLLLPLLNIVIGLGMAPASPVPPHRQRKSRGKSMLAGMSHWRYCFS